MHFYWKRQATQHVSLFYAEDAAKDFLLGPLLANKIRIHAAQARFTEKMQMQRATNHAKPIQPAKFNSIVRCSTIFGLAVKSHVWMNSLSSRAPRRHIHTNRRVFETMRPLTQRVAFPLKLLCSREFRFRELLWIIDCIISWRVNGVALSFYNKHTLLLWLLALWAERGNCAVLRHVQKNNDCSRVDLHLQV